MWSGHKGRGPSSTVDVTTADGAMIEQVTGFCIYINAEIWFDVLFTSC